MVFVVEKWEIWTKISIILSQNLHGFGLILKFASLIMILIFYLYLGAQKKGEKN